MNFDYEKHLIYKCMAGSRSYGTETESSDTDYKGIIIPPIEYLVGTQNFDQHMGKIEEENTEWTYFALGKFCRLASKCNPNVIEMLFVRDEDVLVETKWSKILRDERHIFLSRAAVYSYTGYAMSQLKRIRLHRQHILNPPKKNPERADYNLPNETLIPKDQLKAAETIIRRKLHEMAPWLESSDYDKKELFWENLDSLIVLYARSKNIELPEFGDWQDAELEATHEVGKLLGFSNNFLEHLANEKTYRRAKQQWVQYNEWKKNRNPARAALEEKYGLDCKHAMHLVRLMRSGEDLLRTGTFQTYRDDHEELLSIRDGAWTYEEVVGWAEKKDKEIYALSQLNECPLPKKPNYKRIEKILIGSQLEFNRQSISEIKIGE